MSQRPFPTQAVPTAWAVGYQNPAYIADQVLPRAQVGHEKFSYRHYDLGQHLRVTETLVGRASAPRQVVYGGEERSGVTEDHGLDAPVPQSDLDAAAAQRAAGFIGYDPEREAVEGVTNALLLAREKRVADLVFGAASYGASNKVALSGTDQFSDYAASDPVAVFEAAIEATKLARPNVLVLGRKVWRVLRRHPALIRHALGEASTRGYILEADLAHLAQVERVIVGEAMGEAVRPGVAPLRAELWGKHAALLHVASAPSLQQPAFGVTAQFGGRVAGWISDPDIGLKGGRRYRVGEQLREVVLAADSGYLIQNAVS